jgi:hypothetical protein
VGDEELHAAAPASTVSAIPAAMIFMMLPFAVS